MLETISKSRIAKADNKLSYYTVLQLRPLDHNGPFKSIINISIASLHMARLLFSFICSSISAPCKLKYESVLFSQTFTNNARINEEIKKIQEKKKEWCTRQFNKGCFTCMRAEKLYITKQCSETKSDNYK